MLRNDFLYVTKRTNRLSGTIYYSCKEWRRGCQARLIQKGNVYVDKNEHSCKEALPSLIVDVRTEMRLALEERALAELSTPPTTVWDKVMSDLRTQHGDAMKVIPKPQGTTIIKNARAGAHGGDAIRALESKIVRSLSPTDDRPFLLQNLTTTHVNGDLERILLFGHPDLVRLLHYPGCNLYIDGTFKMAPPGFAQCLIIMVHDPSVDLYVPVMYALLERKKQDTYWNVLNLVIIKTDHTLEPATVTCDFEQALINAVVEQFPKATIVGCLFHFKQSIRRKLLDVGIAVEKVGEAMQRGKLDILTIIPASEIDKGIRFVRSVIDETGAKQKWQQFWQYFRRTWMSRYDVSLWNVSAMVELGVPIQNRTNNPLEKYNRDFGDRFGRARPSLLAFVAAAKEDSMRYAQLIEDIKKGRAEPPVHATEVDIVVPAAYTQYE